MGVSGNTILHIANDYAGSKVYKNLVYALDQLDVQQIIYTAIREKDKIGSNEIDFQVNSSKTIYSAILNWHIDRAFYPIKIAKIFKDIQSKVDFSQIQCIHAHTWYSDGGVAYLLSRKYNIPFIIAIRSTDINLFQKKLVYLRPFGRKILSHAKQVILISASYKEKVLGQSSLRIMKSQLQDKLRIIPNGVDPFWIENSSVKQTKTSDTSFNILYIGSFISRKNVLALQQAMLVLRNTSLRNPKLHIVGGGGGDEPEILKLVAKHPDVFTYHGEIHDKQALLALFQNCDVFAMPSLHETFGLVYVEAMLQGLPILYTKSEGVDGFYNEKIGEKVSTHSVEEIKEKLELMINNFGQYSIPIEKIKKTHDWALIAKEYKNIYQNCIKPKSINSDNNL